MRTFRISEQGQTTLEYMMVVGIMAAISILVTGWLVEALKYSVGLLAFKIAILLTSFPGS